MVVVVLAIVDSIADRINRFCIIVQENDLTITSSRE